MTNIFLFQQEQRNPGNVSISQADSLWISYDLDSIRDVERSKVTDLFTENDLQHLEVEPKISEFDIDMDPCKAGTKPRFYLSCITYRIPLCFALLKRVTQSYCET